MDSTWVTAREHTSNRFQMKNATEPFFAVSLSAIRKHSTVCQDRTTHAQTAKRLWVCKAYGPAPEVQHVEGRAAMAVTHKTKAQLLQELVVLRQRNAQLEAAVAEQQQTAAAERASAQRYRHMVEQSLGLMCMHSLDGTLLAVNPAATQALGYAPEAWRGRNLREFLAPAVQPLFEAYLARIRHEPRDSGLMRLVTATGEER